MTEIQNEHIVELKNTIKDLRKLVHAYEEFLIDEKINVVIVYNNQSVAVERE
jgi:hypothetical protein